MSFTRLQVFRLANVPEAVGRMWVFAAGAWHEARAYGNTGPTAGPLVISDTITAPITSPNLSIGDSSYCDGVFQAHDACDVFWTRGSTQKDRIHLDYYINGTLYDSVDLEGGVTSYHFEHPVGAANPFAFQQKVIGYYFNIVGSGPSQTVTTATTLITC